MTRSHARPAAAAAIDGDGPSPHRRALMRGLAAGACLAAWPMVASARTEPVRVRVSRPLMGTRVDIAVQSPDGPGARLAIGAAFERMSALVDVMSHYAPTSRVAAVNLAAGIQPVEVPAEMLRVVAMAREVSQRSEGAFDITIGSVGKWHFDRNDQKIPTDSYIADHLPFIDYRKLVSDTSKNTLFLSRRGMRIDLGGIAKLYILQAGMNTLRDHGVQTALINGGGDVVASSRRQDRPWRVGIRDPRRPERLLATLDVRQGFVASSGDYERFFVRDGRRYHHVLDPRTGYPAQGPHGVTLVGEELEAVNGFGAAAMVLDARAGRALLQKATGAQALVAGRDQSVWITPALADRLQAPPGMPAA